MNAIRLVKRLPGARAAVDGLQRMLDEAALARQVRDVERYVAFPTVAGSALQPRLTLIVPSISPRQIFGGISTALELFRGVIGGLGAGTRARMLTIDPRPTAADAAALGATLAGPSGSSSDAVVVAPLHADAPVAIDRNDVFMATYWPTALAAGFLVEAQAALHGLAARQFIYLIQDFESGFYPWSAEYALSEATYSAHPERVIAVFNTSVLRDYFAAAGYRFHRQASFEPALNRRLRAFLPDANGAVAKERLLLVYGRPSAPRNAFPLVCAALRRACQELPHAREWRYVSLGEKHNDVALGRGCTLTSCGKVSLEAYADYLRRAAVGLSLMMSPHPSYPPLEMAQFGALTISNCFANKDPSRLHPNIRGVATLTPMALGSAVAQACIDFESVPNCGSLALCAHSEFRDGAGPLGVVETVVDAVRQLVAADSHA